jgi:vacuolar-type H+-ATPase subunit H
VRVTGAGWRKKTVHRLWRWCWSLDREPGDRQMGQEYELSPLDRIRQTEADAARHIAGSREAAEQTIASAREQARRLLAEARAAGQREGQAQYRRIILQAQDEVQAICRETQEEVEALQRAEAALKDEAVRRVVAIITGSDGGRR